MAGEVIYRTSRRKFLSYLSAAPALSAFGRAGLVQSPSAFADTGPLNAAQRRHRAFVIRRDAAIYQRNAPPTPSISNGDEEVYANRFASYSKGEVDLIAYNAYLQALNSAQWADFRDTNTLYNEVFSGFRFTKYDGLR